MARYAKAEDVAALEAEEKHKGPHHEGEAMSEDEEEGERWRGRTGHVKAWLMGGAGHEGGVVLVGRMGVATAGSSHEKRWTRGRWLETLKSNQQGCPAQAPTIACPYCPAAPCRWLPVQQQR